MDWLQKGEIDLMLSYSPQPLRTLRTIPMMNEDLLLVSTGADKLSLDKPLPFSSVADLDLILPSRRHGLRDIVERCARRAGIEIRTVVEADNYRALIELVAAGFGASILPLAPLHAAVEVDVLSAARLFDPAPARELVLAYPADRPINDATRFLAKAATEVTADLVARGIWSGEMLVQPG